MQTTLDIHRPTRPTANYSPTTIFTAPFSTAVAITKSKSVAAAVILTTADAATVFSLTTTTCTQVEDAAVATTATATTTAGNYATTTKAVTSVEAAVARTSEASANTNFEAPDDPAAVAAHIPIAAVTNEDAAAATAAKTIIVADDSATDEIIPNNTAAAKDCASAVAANAASTTADTYAAVFKTVAIGDPACACNTEIGPMVGLTAVVTPIVTATWNGVQLSEKDCLAFMDFMDMYQNSMKAQTQAIKAETAQSQQRYTEWQAKNE